MYTQWGVHITMCCSISASRKIELGSAHHKIPPSTRSWPLSTATASATTTPFLNTNDTSVHGRYNDGRVTLAPLCSNNKQCPVVRWCGCWPWCPEPHWPLASSAAGPTLRTEDGRTAPHHHRHPATSPHPAPCLETGQQKMRLIRGWDWRPGPG